MAGAQHLGAMADHIASIERQTGRAVVVPHREPEAELPPVLWYLWEWFGELSAQRAHGMAGPQPVAFSEIRSWATLRGLVLSQSELRVLLRLDDVYLDVIRAERARKDSAGGS